MAQTMFADAAEIASFEVDDALPAAPTDEEKYCYAEQNHLLFFPIAVFATLCLICGLLVFSVSHPYFYIFLPYSLLIAFYLTLSHLLGCSSPCFDLSHHNEIFTTFMPAKQPSVDVYLPNCGEDIRLLENTFNHVKQLNWDNLQVHVLDDKGRYEVEALSDRFSFHYICRPNRGELKKAGNLRYAFARTSGEFIIIFDADFAPRPDFINELIPYFYADPQTAIVQSPQYFEIKENQSNVQKGAAYVQEVFYRLIQVSRNHWGASVCVGTNAIYRRIALEPFGGTAPIAHSEDMHTGFAVVVNGWKVSYVPINLAKGLCPDRLPSFFIQQYRWCLGSTSLFFSRRFWTDPLPFMVRLCYLSGMLYYISSALAIIMAPLPTILMVWFYPQNVLWQNWLFIFPSLVFAAVYTPLWTRAPFGLYAFRAHLVAYHAHIFALLDRLSGRSAAWVPTNSDTVKEAVPHYTSFKKLLVYWTTLNSTVLIAGAFYHMRGLADVNYYPVIFFALFNCFLSLQILIDSS